MTEECGGMFVAVPGGGHRWTCADQHDHMIDSRNRVIVGLEQEIADLRAKLEQAEELKSLAWQARDATIESWRQSREVLEDKIAEYRDVVIPAMDRTLAYQIELKNQAEARARRLEETLDHVRAILVNDGRAWRANAVGLLTEIEIVVVAATLAPENPPSPEGR